MDARTLKDAKANLEQLMDQAVDDHEPVIITRDGKQACVLVSLEDWNSEEATQYLLRNPANKTALEQSRAQLERGEVVTKTIEELEAMTKTSSQTPVKRSDAAE
jgi:antitoxin YefM